MKLLLLVILVLSVIVFGKKGRVKVRMFDHRAEHDPISSYGNGSFKFRGYGWGINYEFEPDGSYQQERGYGFVKLFARDFCSDPKKCHHSQDDQFYQGLKTNSEPYWGRPQFQLLKDNEGKNNNITIYHYKKPEQASLILEEPEDYTYKTKVRVLNRTSKSEKEKPSLLKSNKEAFGNEPIQKQAKYAEAKFGGRDHQKKLKFVKGSKVKNFVPKFGLERQAKNYARPPISYLGGSKKQLKSSYFSEPEISNLDRRENPQNGPKFDQMRFFPVADENDYELVPNSLNDYHSKYFLRLPKLSSKPSSSSPDFSGGSETAFVIR